MNSTCVFCKIIAGEIPAKFIQRDEDVIVVTDANPVAPQHTLVITTKHWPNVADFVGLGDPAVVAKFFSIAARMGREQSAKGFRLVVNTGPDGGQTVEHLHAHVIAGRAMTWPPG